MINYFQENQKEFFSLLFDKNIKFKNEFLSSQHSKEFFWKYQHWFLNQTVDNFGVVDWYRYWLILQNLFLFLTNLKKSFLFKNKIMFICTKATNFAFIKYFAEKTRQYFLIGFNREFFSRFVHWQKIYYKKGLDYKFGVSILPSIVVFIQGNFVYDSIYLKFFANRFVYLIKFFVLDFLVDKGDFKIYSTANISLVYFNLMFFYSILLKKNLELPKNFIRTSGYAARLESYKNRKREFKE